jgi:hypothetical protein
MNTQLYDLMHRDVQDLTPDLEALTTSARRRGLSIRRRRQALGTLGALGVVAVVAAGATQLSAAPGPGRMADRPAATSPAVEGTVRATGEATAAGLAQLLAQAAEGRATRLAGQSPNDAASRDTYGELRWTPADGSGFSEVGLNVQPGFSWDIYRCTKGQVACSVTRSGGATLMTYEEVTQVPDGNGIRVVADLLRADGVRVVASATNGADLPGNKWQITRPRPPFTAEQLTRVVSQPWWGPRLPARLQAEGAALSGYTDLNEDRGDWVRGRPKVPTPSP